MLRRLLNHRKKISNQTGVGGKGENLAAKTLKLGGHKIIEHNWYNPKGKRLGEIDLITLDGHQYVFVEVKTRQANGNCNELIPEEQITKEKLRRITRAAEAYITSKEIWDASWRIDSVSVVLCREHGEHINHIESIFL